MSTRLRLSLIIQRLTRDYSFFDVEWEGPVLQGGKPTSTVKGMFSLHSYIISIIFALVYISMHHFESHWRQEDASIQGAASSARRFVLINPATIHPTVAYHS